MTGVFSPGRELAMYRTQGLDVRSVSKLSQAAAHPRRGTNNTRNGISCKECRTCYTTREENAKEKSVFDFKDLHARDAARRMASGQLNCYHDLVRLCRILRISVGKIREGPRRPSLSKCVH